MAIEARDDIKEYSVITSITPKNTTVWDRVYMNLGPIYLTAGNIS